MSSPTDLHRPQIPPQREGSNSEDGTFVGENGHGNAADNDSFRDEKKYLTLDTAHDGIGYDHDYRPSPSQTREQEHRLDDDLAVLQVERQISHQISKQDELGTAAGRTASLARSRSRRTDPVDDFDIATNPIHTIDKVYKPPENPTTRISKFFKRVHESNWLIRYFTYIIPIAVLLLIPILLGTTVYYSDERTSVGGVYLRWFGIWLEILWLTIWCARILAKCLPWPIGILSSLFTNNSKKWRDLAKELEIPATLMFWGLAVLISWLPTMTNHLVPSRQNSRPEWINIVNKIIIGFFVGFVLNFLEKLLIQLISISFHLRTYADRIEINKFQIASLVKLYIYSKEKIGRDDSDFEDRPSGGASGARTPMQFVENAQRGFVQGFRKVGDAAGKVAGDFTGKQVMKSNHPHQVVLALLNSTPGSQILARRLYRTFVREDEEGMAETIDSDDMRNAFDNDDEADAAFTMFDKDLNGDITMEELEAVCVEIGRERKTITASLKDLESVVAKLNNVLVFVVMIITILVFLTIISTSAAGVLTSLGSSVLGLSWLFSVTAQEFLQSIIFVFVKHPFDVGDRVTIYGTTGAKMQGDDYFVKEISLLYTEFKKMEGHVVQAPNSYLNTLFILNMRRSGGLAEAVPIIIKFGTTLEQIEGLRMRLFDFVKEEKREYQPNILTEVREVTEAYSLTMNVVFFYKSNWQNELLRLQRRNKFICAMMVAMQEVGIEGPRAGQRASFPFYISQNNGTEAIQGPGAKETPDRPLSTVKEEPPIAGGPSPARARGGSILRSHPSIMRRARGESVSSMAKRVDFSLGMKDVASGDITGDLYDNVSTTSRNAEQLRNMEVKRAQRERQSQEREREESMASATGRDTSTARFGGLNRASTESARTHRNRFFGHRSSQEDPATLAERGMASPNQGGSSVPMEQLPRVQHIDTRSGITSPQAVRLDTNSSSLGTETLRYPSDITNQPFPSYHVPSREVPNEQSVENTQAGNEKQKEKEGSGEKKKD